MKTSSSQSEPVRSSQAICADLKPPLRGGFSVQTWQIELCEIKDMDMDNGQLENWKPLLEADENDGGENSQQ